MFERNQQEYRRKKYRIIINEGGSGSSKTVSLAQLMATILLEEERARITITRKTLPSLKASAMRDFLDATKELGIYKEWRYNKTDHIFKYKKCEVDFLAIDDPMKVRSRRRDYLWMNEANEFDLEDYRQLAMRTSRQIFMDYNPSHQYHWIYDEVQTRKDCVVIRSTYKDNPFLPDELVREIENYKTKDNNFWRIYGLGLKGMAEATIYSHWQLCDELPANADRIFWGLDFGYNNQTALLKIAKKDETYYWEEKLYERYLTNRDLIEKMNDMKVSKEETIYGDAEEPSKIKEIQEAGYNIQPTHKGKDSVKVGIDEIKARGFYITKSSLNILKEAKMYSWKVVNGKPIDEPVKVKDHLMDAGRGAIHTDIAEGVGGFPDQTSKQNYDEDDDKGKPDSADFMDMKF